MSLRARILALFLGLGVVPILLLGVIGYARSMRAVRGLLEEQTSAIAHQVASELRDRHERRISELLLLAENAETQRLYRATDGSIPESFPSHLGEYEPTDSVVSDAEVFLEEAWELIGGSYREINLLDSQGRSVFSLGTAPPLSRLDVSAETSGLVETTRLSVPIQDLQNGQTVGLIEAEVRLRSILPTEALQASFGPSGYTLILDRGKDEILHHASRRYVHQPLSTLFGEEGWNIDVETLEADSGDFAFDQGDSSYVASFVTLRQQSSFPAPREPSSSATVREPLWTVISVASMEEFSPPFRGARRGDLIIVVFLATIAGGAFLVTLRRTTASLESLTEASERVGKGDLDPPLPASGPDEVGRLSAAFGLMVQQLRGMLRRVEETRQMAVMGELASSLSHQIRNPLTSIKLNLQGLEEEAGSEGLSETSVRSLRICLREVGHLEDAVRKILGLTRTHPPTKTEASLHGVISESLELLQRQLEANSVRIETDFQAEDDRVLADPEELKNLFVNLLVNAEEAMPEGGTVFIASDNPPRTTIEGTDNQASAGSIRVRIRDEGPGVPDEIKDQIFRPFVTTKPEGTGFGLAVARMAVQEHGGTIILGARGWHGSSGGLGSDEVGEESSRTGATFVVELPLAVSPRTTQEDMG